jgi:hypothetical protein
VRGSYSKFSSPTLTLKLKWGSTVLYSTGAFSPAGTGSFEWDFVITSVTPGASATVYLFGESFISNTATTFAGSRVFNAILVDGTSDNRITGFNTTTQQDLSITATWSAASASNAVEILHFTGWQQLITAI